MDLIKKAIIDYTVALRFLREKKLWVLLLIPGAIGFILGLIFLYLAYVSGTIIADFFSGLYPFEFGKKAANTFFHLIPITYIIAIMLLRYVIYLVLSPFMSRLSRRVESKYMLPTVGEPLWMENRFVRTLKVAGRSFYKEVLWTILFCVVGILVPVAGIVGFVITQSYYIGVMHLDYTLARKMSFSDMLEMINKNRGLPLGNGFIYITLIFIPFLGILLAPVLATSAGTISTLDMIKGRYFQSESIDRKV